jgi:hypothetical protein
MTSQSSSQYYGLVGLCIVGWVGSPPIELMSLRKGLRIGSNRLRRSHSNSGIDEASLQMLCHPMLKAESRLEAKVEVRLPQSGLRCFQKALDESKLFEIFVNGDASCRINW